MPNRTNTGGGEHILAIARDLRAYASSGMEPAFAAKLLEAAEEIERRTASSKSEGLP
jgi:hypothetical protein